MKRLQAERIAYSACPLCESKAIAPLRSGDCSGHAMYHPALSPTMQWSTCTACGHVFTAGYFTPEACAIVFEKTQETQQVGVNLEVNRLIAARMVEKVLPYASSGTWLDVGFGNGSLLFAAQEYGFDPVGIDLRPDTVALMRTTGIEAHCINLAELKLPAPCRVISMADVLEHIPYPATALAEAARLLADDGVLLISMPNSDSVLWRVMDAQNINPYWGEIEHYHNFSRKRLYELLQAHGFTALRYGVSERYRACMEIVAAKSGAALTARA